MHGALTIAAQAPVSTLAPFKGVEVETGRFFASSARHIGYVVTRGNWECAADTCHDGRIFTYYVAADGHSGEHAKRIDTFLTSPERNTSAKWTDQMDALRKSVDFGFGYAVMLDNESGISLLSHKKALYLVGIYDTVVGSVRLAWSTDHDFVSKVKAPEPARYLIYRYPTISSKSVFIHAGNVASKWYVWSKAFTGTDGVLRAFNVLENFLFK